MSLAGQALKWTGKAISKKAIQAGGSSENAIIKKFGTTVNDLASKYGKNTDELLGPISEKNRGGTLGTGLKEAEKIIQQTVNEAGSDIKIDGSTVITALKGQLKLQKAGLDDEVVSGLTEIIKQAEKKYKNGITAKQALTILRQANSKYGKAMATTPKGSTTKVAQMTIADTMRETLKSMFPEIEDSLNTQSEILTLRPIIEKARGSEIAGKGTGIINKNTNLMNPLTYPVVGPMIETIGNKVIPGAVSTAGTVLTSPLAQRTAESALTMPSGEQPVSEPTTLDTGTLTTPQTQETTPTGEEPILSPGGQWQWDSTQNDWVPRQTTETEAATKTLTGYTPEKLYEASGLD